jgi:hypothetical protein
VSRTPIFSQHWEISIYISLDYDVYCCEIPRPSSRLQIHYQHGSHNRSKAGGGAGAHVPVGKDGDGLYTASSKDVSMSLIQPPVSLEEIASI